MFDKQNNTYRHVNCADVRMALTGAAPFNAVVYLTLGQRLSDLLNDQRHFIPVRLENGETMIAAKSQIVSITEIDSLADADTDSGADAGAATPAKAKDRPAPRRGFNPYAVLRISPDADLDVVRAAYKARMKAVHPDTVASLGLDDDLARAALLAAQKVNFAYKKIMRERAADGAEDAAVDIRPGSQAGMQATG